MKILITFLKGAAIGGILAFMLCGCSVIRIHDNQRDVSATMYVPTWPWDSAEQLVSRVNVSAHSNSTTIALRDVSQTTYPDTNFNAIIAAVVTAAVKAARTP